jgi:hypothetical protein
MESIPSLAACRIETCLLLFSLFSTAFRAKIVDDNPYLPLKQANCRHLKVLSDRLLALFGGNIPSWTSSSTYVRERRAQLFNQILEG